MNTNRVFYVTRRYAMIPRILVSGKYHIIGLKGKYPEISPWFIKWKPHTPCFYCDKGTVVYNSGNALPKWWHWQYAELGIDADKHNLPHGLSFSKGNGHNLPKRAKTLINMILTYTDNNLVTQKEYDELYKKGYVFQNFNSLEEVILARKKRNNYKYLTIHDLEKVITFDLDKNEYTIKPKEDVCEN